MKLENGKIVINVYDLIRELGKEHRDEIIDALACQDEVINEVVNQVLDGWTTRGSHAGTGYGGDAEATLGIDGARMRIAKESSALAAEEIKRLGEQLAREKARATDAWNQYHELQESRRRLA
jgi:hypothetical protein